MQTAKILISFMDIDPPLCSDADSLDVRKFSKPWAAEFAAVAGLLYAAERQPWFGGDHLVDETDAGFDLVEEPPLFRWIIRPDTRGESERCLIRELDSVCNIGN